MFYSVYPREANNKSAPNIRSNDVDGFDHCPEDGSADLGLSREADGDEGAPGTKIFNRLLVRSALSNNS
jgi:hypothetical protein